MTVKEFADKTYYKVKSAKNESEVSTIIHSALEQLTDEQVDIFINWYLHGPKILCNAQENASTINNLAKARAILQAQQGGK